MLNLPHCLTCSKILGDYRSKYCKKHAYIAEKNSMWKGEKVQYTQLHTWVKSRLPKPKLCENCKKVPPYDLANITGKYTRELLNWKWFCRKCHMKSDGRLVKFISHTNAGKKGKDNGNYKHGKYCKDRFFK
jgi:hypothetical protein